MVKNQKWFKNTKAYEEYEEFYSQFRQNSKVEELISGFGAGLASILTWIFMFSSIGLAIVGYSLASIICLIYPMFFFTEVSKIGELSKGRIRKLNFYLVQKQKEQDRKQMKQQTETINKMIEFAKELRDSKSNKK